MIKRLDDLTDEKVISDEYFEQLRQKDSKYRITLKEIVILKDYRTKLIQKQNKFIKQRSNIVANDSDLISWRNLVGIKSTEQKKKFSEELEDAYFEQDELDKYQSLKPKKKHGTREKTAYTILIEKIIKKLMESNESIPKTKEVIQAIKNNKFDPEKKVFQDYDNKKEEFYFNNPNTRKEYKPIKLKSIRNRIAEIFSRYK